jgi:hypothetical protein
VHDKPQPGDQQQQLQVRRLTAMRAQSATPRADAHSSCVAAVASALSWVWWLSSFTCLCVGVLLACPAGGVQHP